MWWAHCSPMTNSTEQRIVTEFETVDHGVEHEQYFQGCGVSYTLFEHVATGCGNNAAEAFEDVLEQIACSGFDVRTIEGSEYSLLFHSEKAHAARVPEDSEDCFYYVSIRWNTGGTIETV